MPDRPDPDSRAAILAAATELFARQGLEGTTIKEIGRRAGVTPGLLYYYFADKDALYLAVIEAAMEAFPGRLAPVVDASSQPREGLAALIRMQAEVFLAQPLLPRLMVRELADHEARHAAPVIREHAQRLLQAITALITRGQQAGVFRRDVEPRLAAISALSQVNWFCIAGPVIELLIGQDGAARSPEMIRGFAEHVVQFTMAALEARG